MFVVVNVLIIIMPNKKYECFRLPTVPKFRSPTLIFRLSVLFFLQLILLPEKCFQFQVNFCCNLYWNLHYQKCFCNVIQLLSNENEGAKSRDTTWQTEKCKYTSSVFQTNEIISKNNPTYLP